MLRQQFESKNNLDSFHCLYTWLPVGHTLDDVKQLAPYSIAASIVASNEDLKLNIFWFLTLVNSIVKVIILDRSWSTVKPLRVYWKMPQQSSIIKHDLVNHTDELHAMDESFEKILFNNIFKDFKGASGLHAKPSWGWPLKPLRMFFCCTHLVFFSNSWCVILRTC